MASSHRGNSADEYRDEEAHEHRHEPEEMDREHAARVHGEGHP